MAGRPGVGWRLSTFTPGESELKTDVISFARISRGRERTLLTRLSHEALLLEYEEALTRGFTDTHPISTPSETPTQSPPMSRSVSSIRGETAYPHSPVRPPRATGTEQKSKTQSASENLKHYNVSSHFIWIGDRTRQIDGAHVEYFRGIANPM